MVRPLRASVRCACAHPKVQGTRRNTRGVWQGERGVLTGQRLIARLSRAVASGPVGPVFTGPPLLRCTHGASLAEPRLLRKAWLREATRRGAHFKKCLRNYLRRPEIKKKSWGACTQTAPAGALTRASSFKHPQTKRFVYGPEYRTFPSYYEQGPL